MVEAGEGPPERERGEMGGVPGRKRPAYVGAPGPLPLPGTLPHVSRARDRLQTTATPGAQRTDLELYYFAWK